MNTMQQDDSVFATLLAQVQNAQPVAAGVDRRSSATRSSR